MLFRAGAFLHPFLQETPNCNTRTKKVPDINLISIKEERSRSLKPRMA